MTIRRENRVFNAKPLAPASEANVQAALTAAGGPLTGPPTSSPVPQVTGNVRVIHGRHSSVPLARSYDLYLSDTNASAPDAAHLAANTNGFIWQIAEVPDVMAIPNPDTSLDKSLQPGVTYYVAIVAKNDLGAAAASAWVPVSLRPATNGDISDEYTYLGRVLVDQLDAGNLSAAVTLTGILKTRQTEMDPGGEFDTLGIRGYAPPDVVGEPAPLQVEIPFDGRTAYFAGDIAAAKLDAYQGADLHGDANNVKADGGVTLETGSSAGSSAAPSVTQGIPSVALTRPSQTAAWGASVQFDAAEVQGFNWDAPSGQFIAAQNVSGKGAVSWRISTSGTVTAFSTSEDWGHYAWLRDPVTANNTFYWLTAQVGNPSNLWISGLKLGVASKLQIPRLNTAETPVGTWASTGQLRISERVSNTIVTRSYSISGTNPVLTGTTTSDPFWSTSQKIGSINVTQGPGFAAAQSVFCPRGSGWRIRVANSGATELPDYEWDATAPIVAICPNGPDTASSGGSWYGLGSDNRLYTYTNSTWTGSFTKRVVVGTTSATSTAETQVGSKVAVDWKRRHQMTVTAPQLITPAIRAGVYAVEFPSGTPTDGAMFRHGYTASGGRTLTIPTVLTSGVAPGTAPTAGAYPIAAPAWLRSEATDADGAILNGEGNGDFRAGPIAVEGATPTILRGPDGGPLLIPHLSNSSAVNSIPSGQASPYTTVTNWSNTAGLPLYTTQASGNWTMLYAGSYLFDIGITYGGSGTTPVGRAGFILFKNGSEYRRYLPAYVPLTTVATTITVTAAVNDVFAVKAYQNTGASVVLGGLAHLGITRLSQAVN